MTRIPRDSGAPELDALFTDIEWVMGAEPGSAMHHIYDISVEAVGWWQRFFGTGPVCEICGQAISGAAVRFHGPFVEQIVYLGDPRFAACLGRAACDKRRQLKDQEMHKAACAEIARVVERMGT